MNRRVAAIMQVGRRRIDVRDFQGSVGQAARPLNLVPVDFEVGAKPEFARRSLSEDAGQVNKADLVAPGGEAEIRVRYGPFAVAIGDFEAERHGLLVLALAERDVDG